MFETFDRSKLAATAAVFVLGLAAAGIASANADVLVNGWFTQPGPNGSQGCMRGPASGWSAAAGWSQWAVVPNSYICTYLESTFLPRIRVRTNGGDYPNASMGNGIGQNFKPMSCAIAKYWYNVTSGQVTGNLVRSDDNAFVDFKTVLQPVPNNPSAWKPFTSMWDQGAAALDFETLSPVGIIPEVNYQLMDATVEACTGLPPIKDLWEVACAYPNCLPFYTLTDPGGPVEKFRVTNMSSVTVQGPIHAFIEGLPTGRAVVNPDGDYRGSPYINLVSGSLAPGQSEDVTIQFNAISTGAIPGFRVRLVSGDF